MEVFNICLLNSAVSFTHILWLQAIFERKSCSLAKVPGTFEKNRPYTRGRKIQTAYNASSHYHSIVQENCLSPVLSDSGTALETHPNSFLLLSLFRLEVGMQEKTHFHNRIHQQSFGREIMNDGPLGFMHGKRHITK